MTVFVKKLFTNKTASNFKTKMEVKGEKTFVCVFQTKTAQCAGEQRREFMV